MWTSVVLCFLGIVALGQSDDVVYTTGKLSQEDYDFIRRLPDKRAVSGSYKYKYVGHNGAIHTTKPAEHTVSVAATMKTSEKGHYETALIVSYMVRHMPTTVFERLATRSKGVGVFAHGEGLSSYPEMARTKDTPACRGRCDGSCSPTCTFDGRKWDTVAGSGGSRALVLEDNVLCLTHDPYHHRYNVLIHEFGHTIKFYGVETTYLTKGRPWAFGSAMNLLDNSNTKLNKSPYMIYSLINLKAAFASVIKHHIYGKSYALSNENEYFAEGTQAFFNVNHQGFDGGLTGCNGRYCKDEIESRLNVKKHTPDLFEILVHTYTNGDLNKRSGLKVCQTQ